MSENSKIEWTDHTFNPWWGCTRVSEGVPFFFKQWGGVNKQRAGRTLDGRTWNQFPM